MFGSIQAAGYSVEGGKGERASGAGARRMAQWLCVLVRVSGSASVGVRAAERACAVQHRLLREARAAVAAAATVKRKRERE